MTQHLTRRSALKSMGAGATAVTLLPWLSDQALLAFTGIQQADAAPAPLVLNASQYATLETIVDAIIPTDERSPGAKDARVADYIDLLLSEADASLKQQWLDGLAAVDADAVSRFGAPVAKLSSAQTDQLLTAIGANELNPTTALERFFVMTKQATINGYYTSEIGIHQDLRYKGNQVLVEFHGCQTVDGKDCPYCGQKAVPSSTGGVAQR